MLDELKVIEFYTPLTEYPHVSMDITVKEAFSVMHNNIEKCQRYQTILVLGAQQQLKGFVSLRSIIRAIWPEFLKNKQLTLNKTQYFPGFEQSFIDLADLWQENFTLKCKNAAKKCITQAMKKTTNTVTLDDSIATCVQLIILQDFSVLPVMDEGRVIGVIHLVDIFEEIADEIKG